MDTKLTLKLDESIIKRAKKYASERKVSLSSIIESYLDNLTLEQENDFEISPFVKSIATGKSVPVDIEDKMLGSGYLAALEEKYR